MIHICTEAILKQGKIDRDLSDKEIRQLGEFALVLFAEFNRLTDESIQWAKRHRSN